MSRVKELVSYAEAVEATRREVLAERPGQSLAVSVVRGAETQHVAGRDYTRPGLVGRLKNYERALRDQK